MCRCRVFQVKCDFLCLRQRSIASLEVLEQGRRWNVSALFTPALRQEVGGRYLAYVIEPRRLTLSKPKPVVCAESIKPIIGSRARASFCKAVARFSGQRYLHFICLTAYSVGRSRPCNIFDRTSQDVSLVDTTTMGNVHGDQHRMPGRIERLRKAFVVATRANGDIHDTEREVRSMARVSVWVEDRTDIFF